MSDHITVGNDPDHDLPGESEAVLEAKRWVYERLKPNCPTVNELDWIEAGLHQAYAAGFEAPQAERDGLKGQVAALREALYELVKLQHLKDSEGKTAEYLRRRPEAWQAAKKALSGTALAAQEWRAQVRGEALEEAAQVPERLESSNATVKGTLKMVASDIRALANSEGARKIEAQP